MRLKLLIIFSILFLLPSFSVANTWEYITHGGYDSAVSAWTRVALIFSDSNYKYLFISVIVLGALAMALATYIRVFMGAQRGAFAPWAVPVLIGMILYAAFIVPKGKIVIYDELLNRGPHTVDGIPILIATTAGILNKIEKGFVDIISTSADPASSYRYNAGGTGWNVLGSVSILNFLPPQQYGTVVNFVRDCVYMELQRAEPNKILDIDKIARGEQKFDTIISESANPALFTVVFAGANQNYGPAGTTMSCKEAASVVNSIFSVNQNRQVFDNAVKAACASWGYDVTRISSLNVCKNLIESTIATTLNQSTAQGLGFNTFVAQGIMAEAFREVMTQSSLAVAISIAATAQTQSQFIGLGVHANSWIPVLKESLSAIAIGVTPLVLLFVATPLAGRALSLVVGMFVWLTMWGVTDAVVHSFGVDLAKQASSSINVASPDMGLTAIYMFPGYAAKVAATFGALRWSGLMLASVMSAMLIRFGGAALAMLAGSIAGMPQSSGAQYGSSIGRFAGGVFQSEILPTQTFGNAAAFLGVDSLMRGMVIRGAAEMAGTAKGNLMAYQKAGLGGMVNSIATGVLSNIGHGVGRHLQGLSLNMSPYDIAVARGYGSLQDISGRGYFATENMKFILTPEGLRVHSVDTGLISAMIGSQKEKSFSRISSMIREAIESKGINEAYKIFESHKKEFSTEDIKRIERAFSEAKEKQKGQEHSVEGSYHNDKQLESKIGARATVGAKSPFASVEAMTEINAGIKNTWSHKEANRTTKSDVERLASAITEAFLKMSKNSSSRSSGSEFVKNLVDSDKYNEVVRSAQDYRESESVQQILNANQLPIIIHELAKKYGGNLDFFNIDAYTRAYREIVEAVYRRDYSIFAKYLNDEYDRLNLPQQDIKNQVQEGLNEQERKINAEHEKIQSKKDQNLYDEKHNVPKQTVPTKPVKKMKGNK